MKIELKEKPKKGAIIIEGFPGFGLVSTIATEYLIDHLGARLIGKIESEKVQPIVAIHKGQIIEPLGIFYDSKNNIVIIRAISNINGLEWELTQSIVALAEEIKAKEIISTEGISSDNKLPEPEAFYFTKDDNRRKIFERMNVREMSEGIIMGVTASLLTKMPETTFIFSEANSSMPDSRAAAKIIEIIYSYLGLKVDYKPLLKKAEIFEKQIKEVLFRSKNVTNIKEKRETYFG